MRKVTPLGLTLSKLLITLIVVELGLYGFGKLMTRRNGFLTPPTQIGDWKVAPGNPPASDGQRDYGREVTVVYNNGSEDPVHVAFSQVVSANGLRAPQKYLADSDGRISPINTVILKHDDRDAFSLSLVQGVEHDVIAVHWCQAPGGDPSPMATQKMGQSMKALIFKKPLYTCDAWVYLHPTTIGSKSRVLLQQFADALADAIKKSN